MADLIEQRDGCCAHAAARLADYSGSNGTWWVSMARASLDDRTVRHLDRNRDRRRFRHRQ